MIIPLLDHRKVFLRGEDYGVQKGGGVLSGIDLTPQAVVIFVRLQLASNLSISSAKSWIAQRPFSIHQPTSFIYQPPSFTLHLQAMYHNVLLGLGYRASNSTWCKYLVYPPRLVSNHIRWQFNSSCLRWTNESNDSFRNHLPVSAIYRTVAS